MGRRGRVEKCQKQPSSFLSGVRWGNEEEKTERKKRMWRKRKEYHQNHSAEKSLRL